MLTTEQYQALSPLDKKLLDRAEKSWDMDEIDWLQSQAESEDAKRAMHSCWMKAYRAEGREFDY